MAELAPRDKDLIEPDDWLTEPQLDSLWDWFCNARRDQTDPQIVFTKLVNSVRKPYRKQLSRRHGGFDTYTSELGSHTPATSEWALDGVGSEAPHEVAYRHEQLDNLGPRGGSQEIPKNIILRLQDEVAGKNKQLMEYSRLQHEKEELTLQLGSLKEKTLATVRIAIKSGYFPDRYVQMVPNTGRVHVGTTLGGWETFELVRHPHGMVSFKSTCPPEVYLSADGHDVQPGPGSDSGGGSVTCQRHCGKNEKFWIHVAENGRVGIEPVEFPGRFLRLDGNYHQALSLQGVKSLWENFHLVVVHIVGTV